MTGVAVLQQDDRSIHRGSRFTFCDGRRRVECTVSRRLRLRTGELKLWLEGVSVSVDESSRHASLSSRGGVVAMRCFGVERNFGVGR